jgi:hypothetical protein
VLRLREPGTAAPRCDLTYDVPPFVMDDSDAHSLVGCESVFWVGSVGFDAS